MEPTARCVEICDVIREILNELDVALAMETPGVDLRIIHSVSIANGPKHYTDTYVDMDAGRIDLAVFQDFDTPNRFAREKLTTFDFVCLSGTTNPTFKPPLSAEDYMRHGHILVTTMDTDLSRMDAALELLGIHRDIKVRVPHFAAAMSVASTTDLITTLPRILAPYATKHYDLVVSELPVPSPTREYNLVWLKTHTSNAAHAWLRKVARECFDVIGDDGAGE